MRYCQEFSESKIASVIAVPVGDCTMDAASQLSPTVFTSAYAASLTHAVSIGRVPAMQGGDVIPHIADTMKLSDSESDSVAGRLHTVKFKCVYQLFVRAFHKFSVP